MRSMRALVREGRRLVLRQAPRPPVATPDDVLIRVALAGICRTDLYVAEGRLHCHDPVILGHEFAGVVRTVGSAVRNLQLGDLVTVKPWVRCGRCRECAAGGECLHPGMLGVDRDGAFADYVCVPADTVYPLPAVSPRVGAYVEPVAASLAVLNAPIDRSARGLIHGGNRIAQLTAKIMALHGFTDVTLFDPDTVQYDLDEGAYDFAVETVATTEALAELVRAVRPGGTIVLKSRPFASPAIDVRAAVLKELTFRAVNYGPFPEAIELLASGRLVVEDLLGPTYPLEQFEQAFADAAAGEGRKPFLALTY